MNEVKHTHQQYRDPTIESVQHDHRPYWTRAHRDWRVWVGVVLMLAAMMVYLMTNDLAWRPRTQQQIPPSSVVEK